jgi:hypothetical protein
MRSKWYLANLQFPSLFNDNSSLISPRTPLRLWARGIESNNAVGTSDIPLAPSRSLCCGRRPYVFLMLHGVPGKSRMDQTYNNYCSVAGLPIFNAAAMTYPARTTMTSIITITVDQYQIAITTWMTPVSPTITAGDTKPN